MSATILPFPATPRRFSPADRGTLLAAARRLGLALHFEMDEDGSEWATIGPESDGSAWAPLFDAFLIGWEIGRLTLTDVPSGQRLGTFSTAGELAATMLAAHPGMHAAPLLSLVPAGFPAPSARA